jgi:hypothetical protein
VPPLTIFVDSISESGVLALQFNRPVKFNEEFVQQIADAKSFDIAKTKSRILLTKTKGSAMAEEQAEFVYSMIDNAFDIKYMPANPHYATILLQYHTISFDENTNIGIQLNFEDPLLVSYQSTQTNTVLQDRIYVSLRNAQTFEDPTNGAVLENSLLQNLEWKVPKQIPQNLASAMAATTKTIQAMSQSAGWLLLLNLLFGLGLKYIWKALNIL